MSIWTVDTGENDLFIDRENCQRSFNCQVKMSDCS